MVQSALSGLPCYLLQSPSRDRSSLPPYPTCCPISSPVQRLVSAEQPLASRQLAWKNVQGFKITFHIVATRHVTCLPTISAMLHPGTRSSGTTCPHPGFFLLSLLSNFHSSGRLGTRAVMSPSATLAGSEPHCMAWAATSNRPPVNLYRLTASSVRNCVFMVLYVHTAFFGTRNFDVSTVSIHLSLTFLSLRTFLHRFRIPIAPDHITITYILFSLRISRLVIIPPGFMNTYEIFCRQVVITAA
ncbi:hypothetical protein EV421DRAFT_1852604 [Armillaria borealis]|uniref:Uncharacterized protein n=1 Tax=Armillaria borealis TaxID=47425 RepID=A0AA39IWE3_9AGAR|nr:hypothetical protein EV421DRAFT_1852604 [Armillaria borealis]